MSQRRRAKTQGQSLKVAWQDIPWKKVHRHVFRLQKRIYQATPRGVRDKHQDTEERREAKVSCSVLKQREAERSASRL
jgi:uncharacterized NAD(P)/FAD-binding protein YdhS